MIEIWSWFLHWCFSSCFTLCVTEYQLSGKIVGVSGNKFRFCGRFWNCPQQFLCPDGGWRSAVPITYRMSLSSARDVHADNTRRTLCIPNTGWGRTVSIACTTWCCLLGLWTLTIITLNIFHIQLKFLTHCAQTEYSFLLPGILAPTALNTSYKDPNTWIWEIQKYNLFFK